MKRILTLFLATLMLLCACHKKAEAPKVEEDRVLNVTTCIDSDNADMYSKFEGEYKWFECQVTLTNMLTEEYAGVTEVANVFQVVKDNEPMVYIYQHTGQSDTVIELNSFWLEDSPLGAIDINFETALEKVFECNLPKPASRCVTLRDQLGPKPHNAQWILGNVHQQLYVDTKTGIVYEKNPAFE